MAGNEMALKSNLFGWPEPPAALSYGAAVLSVAAAAGLVSLMDSYLQVAPHASLFLLAIMFCTWFGGSRPGLLAVALSTLAFDYFFVTPVHSLTAEAVQLPRFAIFVVTAFFGWSVSGVARRLTESLRHARDELQRSNEELREREELMRVLTENANDLIRLHTTEGRSVYSSPSVERLFGRLPSSIFEFAHPEDQEACQRWWEQVVAGGAGRLQWRVRDGGGNWRWLESSASRLKFKGRPYVLTVCRDITESKLAEEQARKMLDAIPQQIWSGPADGTLDYCNHQWRSYAGLRLERIQGDGWQKMLHPDDKGRVLKAWHQSVATGRPYEQEERHRRADGAYRWFLCRGVPLRDAEGRIERWYGTNTDIEDRKQAEERLRQTERELRLVVDTIPANVWRATPDGAVDFANRRVQETLGFSYEDLAGWNWTNIIHPEDVTGFVDKWRASLASGEPTEMEARVRRACGEYLWYLIRNVPLKDDAGNVVRWYGTGTDITESKRAREALQESEAKLKEAQRIAKLGYWEHDLLTDRFTLSEEVGRIFGLDSGRTYSQDEFQGMIHPDDQQRRRQALDEALQGKRRYDIEYRIIRTDGEVRFVHIWDEIARDESGRPVRMFGTIQDITERTRAEEALRETHSKLELLLDTSPLPITSVDALGRITSWNKAAERLFGWSAEEAVERVCPTVPPEETGEYLELIRRVMRGETYVGLALYRQKMDGGLLYCSVSVAPQRNGRGEPVGATLIVEDITERVRAEEQLKRTNEELRALSARLHSVREEESTRIAREIHDELGGALSSLKWDMEEIGEILSETTAAPEIDALREKVGAMITLTDNTVDAVRRIASELRPTALEEFGLAEALRWHAQQFQARTGIAVNCDCVGEGTELNQEQATALFRVVQEALTNVLRHAQATKVEISMSREAGNFVLTVSDNGKGITKAEKSAPQSLGLLGMRERSHLLGGEIDIESTDGRGTVVTVRVPTTG